MPKDNTYYRTVVQPSRRAAHAVFEQLWSESKAGSELAAYRLLTKLLPDDDFKKDPIDRCVHFGTMSPYQCRLAVIELIVHARNITEESASEIVNQYFGDVIAEGGRISAAMIEKVSLSSDDFDKIRKKSEKNKSSNAPTIQAPSFSTEEDKIMESDANLEIKKTIIATLQNVISLDDPEVRNWTLDHKLALKEAFDDAKKTNISDPSQISKFITDEFIAYLDWRYDGQYINFVLNNQTALSNTKEPSGSLVGASAGEKEDKKAEGSSITVNKKRESGKKKKGGQPQVSEEDDNDAALDEAIAEVSASQKSVEQLSKARDGLFNATLSSIQKIIPIKNRNPENFLSARKNLEKFIVDYPNDQNLFFIFGELLKVTMPKERTLGRIEYFDDLVKRFLDKIKFPDKKNFDAIKNRLYVAEFETQAPISRVDHEIYCMGVFFRMSRSKYSDDIIGKFINIFNGKDIQKYLLGIESRPEVSKVTMVLALENTIGLLPVIEKLGILAKGSEELSKAFLPVTQTGISPLYAVLSHYKQYPDVVDRLFDLFDKHKLDILSKVDQQHFGTLISITLKAAPSKLKDLFRRIKGGLEIIEKSAVFIGDMTFKSDSFQGVVGLFGDKAISRQVKESILRSSEHNALMSCIENGDAESMHSIIKWALDLDSKNSDRQDLFANLINKKDVDGMNILQNALLHNPEIAKFLIDYLQKNNEELLKEFLKSEFKYSENLSVNAMGYAALNVDDDLYKTVSALCKKYDIVSKDFQRNDYAVCAVILIDVDHKIDLETLKTKLDQYQKRTGLAITVDKALESFNRILQGQIFGLGGRIPQKLQEAVQNLEEITREHKSKGAPNTGVTSVESPSASRLKSSTREMGP